MSAKNGQSTEKKAKAKKLKVLIDVAPRNGKASREVVARCGDLNFTDILDPFKASARDKFVARLAEEWDCEPEELKGVKKSLAQKAEEADDQAAQEAQEAAEDLANAAEENESEKELKATPKEVRAAAEAFLQNPKMMDELAEDLKKLGIAGELQLATTIYVVATSRLLDEPLSASVKASSSSGKSFVTESVTSLIPPEDVIVASDITANALFYVEPGSLRHKHVVVGERKHMSANDEAAAANATLALREMLSRGRLDKWVPVKTDNGMETKHVVQEGPISYIETTTQQEVFEEDATRMLSLATDESREQTLAILAMQAQRAAGQTASPDERLAVQLKHQTAQRLLKPLKVRIGYAPLLSLPASKVVARRAFTQLLGCIEVVALLRQMQKKKHPDGHIEATVADYEIVYGLMLPVLRRAFAPLSERAQDLLAKILANALMTQEFSRADCVKWAGVGLTEVRNRLAMLVEAGLVEQTGGGKGTRYTYRVVSTQSAKPLSLADLITPEELKKELAAAKKQKKPKTKKASTDAK
jgi:hypothetical protein